MKFKNLKISSIIKQPLIAVIIVTWNNEKDISNCLESLYIQSYSNYRIIVVDNNSSDNTVSIIKEQFPQAIVINQRRNIFLTGANNVGIRYVFDNFNAEYIMVLNPDTKCQTSLLSKLSEALSSDLKIGAVGPKIKFWNNLNEGLINSAGLIYDGFMQAYDIGFMQKDLNQFNNQKEVFGVSGACILFKVKMLKEIGIYTNSIKMYLDEVELFIRAHKKGWKILYVPSTVLYHNYMQSTSKNKKFNKNKQIMKAWLIIAFKHYKLRSKIAMVYKYFYFLLKSKSSVSY